MIRNLDGVFDFEDFQDILYAIECMLVSCNYDFDAYLRNSWIYQNAGLRPDMRLHMCAIPDIVINSSPIRVETLNMCFLLSTTRNHSPMSTN